MRKMISLALVLSAAVSAGAQTAGGTYNITTSVVSGGGGRSTGGTFDLGGTAGQPAVGAVMNTAPYNLRGGFVQPSLAPTSAEVSIGGRVLTPNGAGLRNVYVFLTGGTLSQPRITRSGPFGYFSFDEVEGGNVYVVSVSSKRYGFAQPSQVAVAFDSISDILFQADWLN